ncbi:ImuA family protein, partial [Skermanella stibiiresistens]
MDVFETPTVAPMAAPTAASSPTPSKAAVLAELRGRIRRMEGIGGADGAHLLPLGVPEVDRALPDGGLPLGCLHEIVGDPGDPFNVAATGFGTALLARIARRRGQIVWITRGDDLHAPGLASYGLTPDRLITVRARRDADILWAMEEALRCRSLGAVLGEIGDIDMVASRRLQLAAESGGVTAFLLRGGETRARRLAATASVTRWRLASAPSAPLAGEPGLGP